MLRWAAACALASGCTLVTHVDVCEREGPVEVDVNRDPTGDQRLDWHQNLAAMPSGGALLAFLSSPPEAPLETRVRYALLSNQGAIVRTCLDDMELTLTGIAELPAVAAPRTTDGVAAILRRRAGPAGIELVLTAIDASGCIDTRLGSPELALDRGPGDPLPQQASIVSLGHDRFAVVWVGWTGTGLDTRTHLLGAVLWFNGATWTYVEPVRELDLAINESGPIAIAAGPEGELGVTWTDISGGRVVAMFAVLDHRLARRVAPDEITRRYSADLSARSGDRPSIGIAFDGSQYMIAVMLGDDVNAPRAIGAFRDPAGRLLSSELDPERRGYFRLGTIEGGSETDVAVTALSDGGFVASWQEADVSGRGDAAGSGLRAIALDAEGRVRFANFSCDRGDFPLNRETAGDQSRPVLATLGDGTILAVYESDGPGSTDRSGFGLRARGFRPRDLFALRGDE